MTEKFFHIDREPYVVGQTIYGNGIDKVDPRIEEALERWRPDNAPSRRDAVYCLTHTDFSTCGVVSPGFIYRVKPVGQVLVLDLNWTGEMEKALLKIKYKDSHPHIAARYPDWNDELLQTCSSAYWAGQATPAPNWEFLMSSCLVAEVLSATPVDPKATKGGWQPRPA